MPRPDGDLGAALPGEQLLRAYSKAESDVFDIARREDFAAGIKLGARLMLAILDDTPPMVHPEPKE